MKLYRYMSVDELNKYLADCLEVRNHGFRARTDSIGYCFLPEKVSFDTIDPEDDEESIFSGTSLRTVEFNPVDCYRFLAGIVKKDSVLVEFSVLDDSSIEESWGNYADPTRDGWYDYIRITEYCVPWYGRETMAATRYHIVNDARDLWYLVNL